MTPQREVLNKLARGDFAVIDPQDRVYFRDVHDHLVRLYDIVESLRDLLAGALETYLSVVNNRINEVVKTLTLITTLFMPLSFVVGFFGMNFFQASEPLDIWTGHAAFVLTLLVLVLTPLGMYLWMRRRAWM
jgi:magnesium transporter